jgi:hypothetical protein
MRKDALLTITSTEKAVAVVSATPTPQHTITDVELTRESGIAAET